MRRSFLNMLQRMLGSEHLWVRYTDDLSFYPARQMSHTFLMNKKMRVLFCEHPCSSLSISGYLPVCFAQILFVSSSVSLVCSLLSLETACMTLQPPSLYVCSSASLLFLKQAFTDCPGGFICTISAGTFVLVTNPDIIFSSSLVSFLAKRALSHQAFYTIARSDLLQSFPSVRAPSLPDTHPVQSCRVHHRTKPSQNCVPRWNHPNVQESLVCPHWFKSRDTGQ